MSPEAAELARALVAAPWWEWRAGVLYAYPVRRGEMPDPQRYCEGDMPPDGTCVPLLDDAATVGVLLAMLPVGYALESPGCDGRGPWAIVLDGLTETHRGPTLGVAVARALLAMWGGS